MAVRRLMVANRGEIAVRIFRTCTRLGIESVAVVAPDDRGALHARTADQVIEIASYLDPAEHVRAALEAGADAVHPGYGFLAENAGFAEDVIAAGLTWVGPPPDALRLGGDKLEAKRIAREAGVPTLPQGSADEIGYPLLVKAAAGGRRPRHAYRPFRLRARRGNGCSCPRSGGCVRRRDRFLRALPRAPSTRGGPGPRAPRRRHGARRPRLLGPAAAPEARRGVTRAGPRPSRLADDAAAARAFAESIGYESAGTAEFLVDGPDVYFLELNGRIQVEHPVTEAVTGLDVVELQLRVAAGEDLDLDVHSRGHAIEARLYAEDPRTFLPQTGRIRPTCSCCPPGYGSMRASRKATRSGSRTTR